MRSGSKPGDVFDELLRRGEIVIHTSDVERQDLLAVKASFGHLVIADTREQVAHINHTAHRLRVVTGQVADAVLTAAGEPIGVGDTIATRHNDAQVGVANREMWTVVDASTAGLQVTGENGRRLLPPAYVREHVELAYATTAYGAQGATVAASHVLVGEHTGAASAYVAMTRGREHNVAHLVAESVEDARRQWCEVFDRDRADLGPSHAAGLAAEAIDRYGPTTTPYIRHGRRPAPSAGSRRIRRVEPAPMPPPEPPRYARPDSNRDYGIGR
jgi:hypothetical protein